MATVCLFFSSRHLDPYPKALLGARDLVEHVVTTFLPSLKPPIIPRPAKHQPGRFHTLHHSRKVYMNGKRQSILGLALRELHLLQLAAILQRRGAVEDLDYVLMMVPVPARLGDGDDVE